MRAPPYSAGVPTRQDVPKRQRQNAQVEPDRPVVNIIQIVLNAPDKVTIAPEIVHLRPTGDTGLDEMLLHVALDFPAKPCDELRSLRARPDRDSPRYGDELRLSG